MKKFGVGALILLLVLLTLALARAPAEARHGGIHIGSSGCRSLSMRTCRGRLEEHNRIADAYGLRRIAPGESIEEFVGAQQLIFVADSRFMEFTSLEDNRYLTSEAYSLLQALASDYLREFRKPLKVTSLLRTREYQFFLARRRISDADCRTEVRCSTHLTGATFDISKRTMTKKQQKWIRALLFRLWKEEKIDPIEENAAFHIMVLPNN